MAETALPVLFYDWNKGMDRNKDGLLIYMDGEYVQVNDVKFFDTINGFIQTGTTIYMPDTLKGINAN